MRWSMVRRKLRRRGSGGCLINARTGRLEVGLGIAVSRTRHCEVCLVIEAGDSRGADGPNYSQEREYILYLGQLVGS